MTSRFLSAFFISLIAFAFSGCSSGEVSGDIPAPALILRSASIADNASVDASVSLITLSYNNLIQLTGKEITLNGASVQASASGMDLEIAVGLEPWKDYELIIPEGAVTLKGNPTATSAAYTLKFNTRTGKDPNAPSPLAQTPVNPKATDSAKALYSRLLDVYGKTMLTGAMGGVAWETDYADFIAAQTGATPVVTGFDYIHMPYSPCNWINYNDITPARTVHSRGGIVQIQWHWNVPAYKGAGEYAFYKDGTNFNPANIMAEGTWENEVAKTDIAELAGYLKLLQDAGIPVLWRPFHEAAGDYKWGAWFWWGTKGVDITKQLYQYLYHQLTDVYNLNNLIWVWTVTTSSEGKPASMAQMQQAYPGDEYVDIVGTDLYPDRTLTDQSAQFALVNNSVEGRKMVALTECGNLIDPAKAKAANSLWLYFMQWYDMKDGKFGFYNYSGPDQWKTVLASPFVTAL